jgi:hypothetical protein
MNGIGSREDVVAAVDGGAEDGAVMDPACDLGECLRKRPIFGFQGIQGKMPVGARVDIQAELISVEGDSDIGIARPGCRIRDGVLTAMPG